MKNAIDEAAVFASGTALDDIADVLTVTPRRKLLDVIDGFPVLETDADFRARLLASVAITSPSTH